MAFTDVKLKHAFPVCLCIVVVVWLAVPTPQWKQWHGKILTHVKSSHTLV